MSTIPRLTLWGMFDYDNTLFDQIVFPDGIEKETFVNALIIEHGENPVLYPSIEYNKKAFGVWSEKWNHSFSRLVRAFAEDYNPLHNFDRNEEYEDTEQRQNESGEKGTSTSAENSTTEANATTDASTTTTGTTDTQTTQNTGTENTVSAYNSSTYQPDTKTDQTGSGTSGTNEERESTTSDRTRTSSSTNTSGSTNANVVRSGKEDRTLKHTAHLYGNIGVTKSQEMLIDELNLRSKHNLYDALIEIFANEFLIAIY